MFFHTKRKWTIDAEYSAIYFRERCLVLSGVKNVLDKIDNQFSIDKLKIHECAADKIDGDHTHEESRTDKQSYLYVNIEELAKNINYNLVIFEEKNSVNFWKRKTFRGLLVFQNSGKNVLITLHLTGHSFNTIGHASATYSVKGKLNKSDFDSDRNDTGDTEIIILNSELLFEGEIRLVQES